VKKAILRLAMLCAIVCLFSGSALAAEIWDGSVAESFAGGSGTAEDPYLIENGAQLAKIGSEGYYRLTADIYLNDTTDWENWTAEAGPANVWEPIPVGAAFSGTLDGDGHTVYGLYFVSEYGGGLFHEVNRGQIRDLSIQDSSVFGVDRFGALVGDAQNSVIENVTTGAKVAGTGAYIAGLAGHAYCTEFISCTNTGSVQNTNSSYTNNNDVIRTGGLVGSSNESVLLNCVNSGDISSYGSQVGGLVGHAFTNSRIIGCENRGGVTALDSEGHFPSSIGGVVGGLYDCVEICNSINIGDVTNQNGNTAGGITGQCDVESAIRNCENRGVISASGNAAGIITYAYGGLFDGCVNWGTVISYKGSSSGIVGSLSSGKVINCTNAGTVTSERGAGGIVSSNDATVANCRNIGSVTGASEAGGICRGAGKTARVLNCWNGGEVTVLDGDNLLAAITALESGCEVSDCYTIIGNWSDEAAVTQIEREQLKSDNFMKDLNDWVQQAQRPNSGYAAWVKDEDGYPAPTGDVPAYIPVEGVLTENQPEHGSIALSVQSAMTEDRVTVTVNADAGYVPSRVWYCTQEAPDTPVYAAKCGEKTFAFSMPYGDAAVYAECVALPENGVWDGTVAEAFAGGDGTENNPYLIGNGEQLALVERGNTSGLHYRLIADIYLNDTADWESWTAESSPVNVWTPIPNLRGVLDGDGHTVYGLYTDASKSKQGLFNQIQTSSVLKNLTIDQSKLFGTEWVGSFAAHTSGTIFNCINRSFVVVSNNFAGGIVGVTGSAGEVDSCTNYGDVTAGYEKAGGITGDGSGILTDCINYGTISLTAVIHPNSATREMPVGGISGTVSGRASGCVNHGDVSGYRTVGGICGQTTGTVERCTNNGTISVYVSAENENAGQFAGGITASMGRTATVSGCVNRGAVFGKYIVGGIAGSVGFNNQAGICTITECTNFAPVTSEQGDAGGICGVINGRNNINVIECSGNHGEVKGGMTPSDNYNVYVGGIVGNAMAREAGQVTIRNCYNTAPISCRNYVGGLAGDLQTRGADSVLLMKNCYNTGTVTGVDKYISGIAGRFGVHSEGGTATLQNCYVLAGTGSADVSCYGGPGTETVTNTESLTVEQMAQSSSFVGFDFDTVWYCAGDGSYPVLLIGGQSGQMGEALTFTAYQTGVVSVTADSSNSEPVYAVLVSYEDGRMKSMDMVQLNPGEEEMLRLQEQGDSVKLLGLSAEWVPFSEAQPI